MTDERAAIPRELHDVVAHGWIPGVVAGATSNVSPAVQNQRTSTTAPAAQWTPPWRPMAEGAILMRSLHVGRRCDPFLGPFAGVVAVAGDPVDAHGN